VLLALSCAVAACGRDDRDTTASSAAADTTTTVAFAQWRTSLDAACAALNSRYADLADAQLATTQDAIEYAADVDRFVRAITDAVEDGGVPSGHRDRAEDLSEQLRELASATRQLSTAAADGDETQARRAATHVREVGAAVDPIATELGVPACGGF
jgi:hypothetical protein